MQPDSGSIWTMVQKPTTTTKDSSMITVCDIKRIWRTCQDSNLRPLPSEGGATPDVPENIAECSPKTPNFYAFDGEFLDHGPETSPADRAWVWVWFALTLMVIWFAVTKTIPQVEHDLQLYFQN